MDTGKPAGAPNQEGRRPAGQTTAVGSIPADVARSGSSHHLQVPWLGRHIGQTVKVGLLTGKVLVGAFVSYDQFCLEIRPAPGADSILVWKHATSYIAPAAEAGERRP